MISVTQLSAGDAFNVIPATALIRGTIRALSEDMLNNLRQKVDNMRITMTNMHGCNSTIKFSLDHYPPTINHETLFPWSQSVASLVSKEGMTKIVEPTMAAEDFSFLAQTIPSTFFFVGQGSGEDVDHHIPRTDYGLHHPSFALDEDVLSVGVELHVNLGLRALKKLGQGDVQVEL